MGAPIRKSGRGFTPNSEINVTPFIDVMLVLLIIFMVVAPISTVNIPLDLPVSSQVAKPLPDKPTIVSLGKDAALHVGDEPVARDALAATLNRLAPNPKTRIFIRADKEIRYEDLMALLDDLRAAGYTQVSLVGMQTS
jgi:TonB system transport protein ExbD (group 1)